MTPALSILIVDDEPLARLKLRQLLEPMRDVHVVGECASGSEARRALEGASIDAMLLDVQMPGISGIDLVDTIPAHHRPHVIFVTAFDVASPMMVCWKFVLVMLLAAPPAAPLTPSTPRNPCSTGRIRRALPPFR